MDGPRGRRSHQHTVALREALSTCNLWTNYGIVNGIMPFTAHFPRADIHELLSPDILHQLIKGVFKDHLVTWVGQYIRIAYPADANALLAEIDRRVAAAPHFPGLRRFKEGRGFKQWTGKDSKAFMKVYLPAISGLVPPRMVQAIRYFTEFCYYVRRSVLDDDDLDRLNELLAKYHEAREVFIEEGVRENFNLPRQHSLTHYRELVMEFGAPNGLCSSITESRHIDAIKGPYKRSSRNEPLSEILVINQRLDKIGGARVNFTARGMLHGSGFQNAPPPKLPDDDDDDGGPVEDQDIVSEISLARKAIHAYPRNINDLAEHLNLPLHEHISRFLYEREHPESDMPIEDVPIELCPTYSENILVYPSAIATFRAPSDISGVGGMYHERIRSTESWRKGPERRDCVFVEQNPDLPGFRGLYVAQVRLIFKIRYKRRSIPCALVAWFSQIGNEPCPDSGMWQVEPDFNADGERSMSVIHLDAIFRAAHLVGIAGENFLPYHMKHTDSLDSFRAFFVNKFIDYHSHESIF
ncbi:hypothetical protein F5887DRAFT_1079269 [Amanita rubescens]|nr:hypothetical protein F5887DRAFT_1079269 [Amanita rubescens]